MNTTQKLALGTVQFGIPYGIKNSEGQVPYAEILKILSLCRDSGITFLDTSRCYGNSEEVLGKALKELGLSDQFKICTKLDLPCDYQAMDRVELLSQVKAAVTASKKALQIDCIPVYLLHTYDYLKVHEGAVWSMLRMLKAEGEIESLGVSICGDTDEAITAMDLEDISYMQIPFNVFDTRWVSRGVLDSCRDKGIKLINRSTYLQGLLLMNANDARERVPVSDPWVWKLKNLAEELGMPLKQLVFCYVLSERRITHSLVGVDNLEQLKENIELSQHVKIDDSVIQRIQTMFEKTPFELVNPSLWPKYKNKFKGV